MADAPEVSAAINIVNMALLKLGCNSIEDWDESSKQARLAKATYASIRNDCLRSHPWKFARQRCVLPNAALPDGTWDYDYAFTKPDGVEWIYSVEGETSKEGDEWTEEGNLILTNLGDLAADGVTLTLKVIAIMRVTDVTKYDASFIEFLCERLQAEWAEPLRQVSKLAEAKIGVTGMKRRVAQSNDGKLGTPRRVTATSFTDAR